LASIIVEEGIEHMADSAREKPPEWMLSLAGELRVWREETSRPPREPDDMTLAAYVSGELDEERQRSVEKELNKSPELRQALQIVSEVLKEEDGDMVSFAGNLDIRPPILVSPSRPQTLIHRFTRSLGARGWTLSAAALLTVLLVGVAVVRYPTPPKLRAEDPVGWEGAPHSRQPEWQLSVQKCHLDKAGQIASREPVRAGTPLRSGERFQIEFTPTENGGFSLLQIGPSGELGVLHSGSVSAPGPAKRVILPTPDKPYSLDDASGLEGLFLIRDDRPDVVLATAQKALEDVMSRTVVRSPDRKLSQAELGEFVKLLGTVTEVASSFVIDHRPD